ncbi:carboxypeptidase-like regulatory domain-containing protein, partial [Arthrospira platensis SPKY1]|nr:carboxypeptidase-like regulatory domain-containing protein [Arthrospira platensis SPKY1]
MYKILLISFFLLTVAGFLSAQEDLVVSILDLQNRPLADVEVVLKNPSRGIELSQTTNAQGRVVFPSLPVVDGYRVFVPASPPYLEETSGEISLRSNQARTIQLILLEEKSVVLDEVTVRAAPTTRINRTDAEV